MISRRNFLVSSVAATASGLIAKSALGQNPSEAARSAIEHPVVIFAKPLQHLEAEELGKRLKSLSVQGIEATLRPGGQIEPEDFARDLQKLVDTLARHGQRIEIATCEINDVSAESEKQLRQFSKVGIPRIRMQYYHYDFTKPILPQLDGFAKQAAELAALCKSLNIVALYQNHAGKDYVGSALWDLQQVLKGIDPSSMAVAIDIRHTALELSQSWRSAYGAIRSQLGAVFVKDVSWIDGKPENVPLGNGIVKPLFTAIQREGLIGPLSLHVEYIDHKPASLQEQRWAAIATDVATLREWLS